MSDSVCSVCGKNSKDLLEANDVYTPIVKVIQEESPEFGGENTAICVLCLNRYRSEYVTNCVDSIEGDLTKLDEELNRIVDDGPLSLNTESEMDESRTLGERASDAITSFAGSWSFLFVFASILIGWMLFNVYCVIFDPYPFILLNLGLSCLAAVQAPFIMMSQGRREARDRVKAENDYLVNLKAELEIQQLNSKVDRVLWNWQHLMKIQAIQTDMIKELIRLNAKPHE